MDKIECAQRAIDELGILEKLLGYTPKVVSTIFAHFDVSDSDIDIVCCHQDEDMFEQDFEHFFADQEGYQFIRKTDCMIGRFKGHGFLFEVYSSKTPVTEQMGYRHFQVMKRLSHWGRLPLQEQIRDLRQKGLKTEPAICQALGLPGDPYDAVLEIENWSDHDFKLRFSKKSYGS